MVLRSRKCTVKVYIQVILHHRSCVVCVGVCVRREGGGVNVPLLLAALAFWHGTLHKAPHQERALSSISKPHKQSKV